VPQQDLANNVMNQKPTSGKLQEGGPSDRLWPGITYHMAIYGQLSVKTVNAEPQGASRALYFVKRTDEDVIERDILAAGKAAPLSRRADLLLALATSDEFGRT